ncbi:hypothetical protein PCG10_002504 [Penicillium crustosum]|uniref:Uncharacterized protein n=1 Tax=Penicillium crustosum TaxID=36656 RepID=A0A9P5GQT6_PENCR|nr:hypothetical protein PCG10_002504 [Penicillium crustosum]
MILEASTKEPSPLKGPVLIPLSMILAAEKPLIEVYFMRHPSEMVMSNEFFIHKMNRAIISLLQQSPTTVVSSTEADMKALSIAYEVMAHISGSPQDIKLSLWPLFIAACELEKPEDRGHVTRLFDDICRARPIVTARRTKSFIVDNCSWIA